MKKLAQNGTLFENAYCPSPLCLPSRSAFVLGKRVHELQTYNNCNLDLNSSIESYGASLEKKEYIRYILEKLIFSMMVIILVSVK